MSGGAATVGAVGCRWEGSRMQATFYRLEPRPVNGEKALDKMLSGQKTAGRRWYRLESNPGLVFLLPDSWQDADISRWIRTQAPAEVRGCCCCYIEGEWHELGYGLDGQGAERSRENAIKSFQSGKRGWVVFNS